MKLMDEHYLQHPDKGPRRMQSWLAREHDLHVNIKRLNRLYYSVMGLQSVLPGPHTSKPAPGHKTYPYLLRGLHIERPNQVWQTAISYVPMSGGYLYLTAWIDVFSRFVLNWSLSNTMSARWCSQIYEQTLENGDLPKSSIPIRVASTPTRFSPARYALRPRYNCAWMVAEGPLTMHSSNGCGVR